jgi:serine phosphatase RsbU (regulator of sigma subunit)/anti-sigma regulatory factor (Ser/Thr protein kinase)
MFKNVKKEIIAIPAQMSYLSQVRDFVEHIGRKYKFTDKVTNSFKLVIEEACTNIIRHGYRDIKGGEITIKAIIRRQSLTMVIIDQGISYDPRQATTPDLAKYIQIGKKGGLGIFMMRKLMDDVQYNITSRGNELRLTKQREIIEQSKPQAFWEDLTMRTRHTIRASAIITVLALFIFFILYLQVDQNTLEDVIESTRAQAFSLADNSSMDLENVLSEGIGDVPLFQITNSFKNNNPDVIYETFIVDSALQIRARGTPLKGLGQYTLPEEYTLLENSVTHFAIYRYNAEDTLDVYDFAAEIHAGIRGQDPFIGTAHIWVLESTIESKADRAKLNIILYLFGLLLIGYAGSYFLIDRIVKPFHSLADWVRDVGQGTVDEDEIDIDASDELGEIAQAFNLMTNKFREAQVSLIEQQRLQKELQVAQEIQQMLLPSDFPQVRGYEIASFYEAAKEVGGDLFDFVEVDKDTIGICVADVAGKGVPGSLIMTMIRTALRLEARGNKNPADVLSRVNRFVTDDMKRGMFVTMFYMILDSRNRIIHYASAGHNPMILYRGSSKQTYYLNPSGFPVGIQLPDISLFDQKIEEDSIRLREDDLLVLYTDGVTEAMNPKRDLYRDERFLDAIRKNAHYDVSEFITNVKDDIKHHTQGFPQNDDITYVGVKEKLMKGEVIYTIHQELFRLIEDEGMAVKDACEEMQVSPYMYRKYKKIKDSVGLEGLKDLLYKTDYIEKKHLSIEIKTKLFDVIRNNPGYGAKRISDELETEKYGFIKIDPGRVYDELKKARLNTKEKRENFIRRGGKKRIKLPGTPLLTLDGEVILDYESAEKVIADRRGTKVTSEFKPPPVVEPEKKVASRELVSKKEEETPPKVEEEEVQTESVKEEELEEEKREAEVETVVSEKAVEIETEKSEEREKDISPAAEKPPAEINVEEKKQDIILEEKPSQVKEPVVDEKETQSAENMPVEKSISEILGQEDEKKKELEKSIATLAKGQEEVNLEIVKLFFQTIKDDMKIIDRIVSSWKDGELGAGDLSQILFSLKIITTHPLLKKLGNIKQLCEQVKKGMRFFEENIAEFKSKQIISEIKDLLKYVEQDNILKNSGQILTQINEVGIKQRYFKEQISKKTVTNKSEIDTIRQKIAKKNIIKDISILESISKSNKD